MKMILNWEVNREDSDLIDAIANRAVDIADAQGVALPKLDILMDITAVHANGTPLELKALLESDRFEFTHDVFGIYKHLNRRTGELENFFYPRYAA
jgi:hypothetical protein